METRANHVLIGVFATVVLLGAFGFIIWLSRFEGNRETKTYDIIYSGTVSGLSVAADVRYNGIKVGQVSAMDLMANDPGKVRVRIDVADTAPVSQDTVATVEFQGITGVSYVLLSGGKPDSKPLVKQPNQEHPVIASGRSGLQDLFQGAPELIARANDVLRNLNEVLNQENRAQIKSILSNTNALTGSLAQSGSDIRALTQNLSEASVRINKFSENLESIGTKADSTFTSLDRTAAGLDGLVSENRGAVMDFTHNGLAQVGPLVTEARALVRSLNRLADQLENDPSSVIYGSPVSEVPLK